VRDTTARHDFLPFGEEIFPSSTNPDGNTKMFTGHERDQEAGLDYMLGRYFGTTIARFVTADSRLSLSPDANLYSYVSNEPMKYYDPDGRYKRPFSRRYYDAVREFYRDAGFPGALPRRKIIQEVWQEPLACGGSRACHTQEGVSLIMDHRDQVDWQEIEAGDQTELLELGVSLFHENLHVRGLGSELVDEQAYFVSVFTLIFYYDWMLAHGSLNSDAARRAQRNHDAWRSELDRFVARDLWWHELRPLDPRFEPEFQNPIRPWGWQ
jgi:RHS repeat-associated protein